MLQRTTRLCDSSRHCPLQKHPSRPYTRRCNTFLREPPTTLLWNIHYCDSFRVFMSTRLMLSLPRASPEMLASVVPAHFMFGAFEHYAARLMAQKRACGGGVFVSRAPSRVGSAILTDFRSLDAPHKGTCNAQIVLQRFLGSPFF